MTNILKTNLLLITLLATGSLTACMVPLDPTVKENTSVVRTAADEVKFISMNITEVQNTESIQATSYAIAKEARLLMRLSALKPNSDNILQEQPILLRIQLRDPAIETDARAKLKICPLDKNWMMFATWKRAHPYSNGIWKKGGGDFRQENCFEALPSNHESISKDGEAVFCGGSGTLCFDLQKWVMSHVRERKIDNGFILINDSDAPILIEGDGGYSGPSLFWRKFRI